MKQLAFWILVLAAALLPLTFGRMLPQPPDPEDAALPPADWETAPLPPEVHLDQVVTALGEELGIAVPKTVTDESLQEVFGIQPEQLDAYYGVYSAISTAPDTFLAVRPQSGEEEAVRQALEKRINQMVELFAGWLPRQEETAQAGQVFEYDGCLVLVIGGRASQDPQQEIQRAGELLDELFSQGTV